MVTDGYRVVTVGYSRLQRLLSGYSRLQQVTQWLQWVTAGYSSSPSGYSGLQQVTTVYRI